MWMIIVFAVTEVLIAFCFLSAAVKGRHVFVVFFLATLLFDIGQLLYPQAALLASAGYLAGSVILILNQKKARIG